MNLIEYRKEALKRSLERMDEFLRRTLSDLDHNSETLHHHLNERLLIQVHLADVLDASHAYDLRVQAEIGVTKVVEVGQ